MAAPVLSGLQGLGPQPRAWPHAAPALTMHTLDARGLVAPGDRPRGFEADLGVPSPSGEEGGNQ